MPLRTSLLTVLALLFAAAHTTAIHAAEAKQPNILFFLIDDQRNDTLGCAGHPIIKTPNIDRLAREGVRFENAFVTTSICAASRATILTGLYERTHGYTFGKPPIRKGDVQNSYPALLRKAGYRTGFIGKFGVRLAGGGQGTKAMFDYFNAPGGPRYIKQKDGSRRHSSEVMGDRAIEFFAAQPKDQPFCLSISFHAVHAVDGNKSPGRGHYPWPKAVDAMYRDVKIPAPRLGDPAIFKSQPEFLRKSMNRDRYFWRWDTPEKYDTNMRAYFRMLSGVDGVIGRVLAALEKAGLDENTVVVYHGDNGYYMGDRGFAGKWSHYEQSLRVPLIVYDPRAPKAQRGKLEKRMALNVDLPATFLDLAGVKVPAAYQGHSLTALLKGQSPNNWRDDFFCEHLMNNAKIPKYEGVRGTRYVYARYFEQKPAYEFLHDLKEDPDQLKNLVGDAKYGEVLKQMRARCDELRGEYSRSSGK
jgi:arylsulfatase A-like enzyme